MKLLLHICCGPCALYRIKKLVGKNFDEVVGYYYNPNIHPQSEYKKRRDALIQVGNRHACSLQIIVPEYKMEEYFEKIFCRDGSRAVPTERCRACWELRLERTAEFAKENGFSAFTTTLLISPYQNLDAIKQIGERIAKEKGAEFYYEDFRKGFKESQGEAREKDIYRQKYCGCVFSELERGKV